MSVPDYYRNVSLVLSRVMNDIGVNEECVMRRRRINVLEETFRTLTSSLIKSSYALTYVFGSQTEGSTTRDLNSDIDMIVIKDNKRVIQDWKDWSLGIDSYMMIRDETTFPGYCKLQPLRPDMPLLFDRLPDGYYVFDEKRRIVLKNDRFSSCFNNEERHGPALQSPEMIKMGIDVDNVYGFCCQTWPKHYKQWSSRREARDWPTPEMVEYMETSGCFVVPVGHRCSERQDLEWRISTSLAERCLMFSLNITQIRCYVILKMISKTFIQPFVPDVISSYICKTLLFHTLERTRKDFWREQNLLACVTRVLFSIYSAVYNVNCPNYFFESANLFLGKLDQKGTRERLLVILRNLLHGQGLFLTKIRFDNINSRMEKYFLNTFLTVRYEENEWERLRLCQDAITGAYCNLVRAVHDILTFTDCDGTIIRDLLHTTLDYSRKGPIQYNAASMMFPFLCSHEASMDTSDRIRRGQNVSPRALQMYKWSLNSDATSSRLRFASFLYCTGQFKRVLSVLQKIEQRMDSSVIRLCFCSRESMLIDVGHGFAVRERDKPFPTTSNVALCVVFSRFESHCCPLEMRFEYFRSTDEERLQRCNMFSDWMDLAMLDCLPFLYYLQYMAAKHLGQRDLQYRALHKLIKAAFGEEVLSHRETAFNVLGQCMEHENRIDKALLCYMMSYRHRPRNNAVRWHITRLMCIINQRL